MTKQELQEALSAAETRAAKAERLVRGLDGLTAWLASNSAGSPVCVGDMADDTPCVNFYRDEEGLVVGIEITQDVATVAAYGLIPAERLMEEVNA